MITFHSLVIEQYKGVSVDRWNSPELSKRVAKIVPDEYTLRVNQKQSVKL